MKLYLDTCNLDVIQEYSKLGILSGVTTTPTFAVREHVPYKSELINNIYKASDGELDIYYTVASDNYNEIIMTVHSIHSELDENVQKRVVYKLSISYDAILASRVLAKEGYRLAMHLIYSVNQALLASKAKIENIFPLVGRSDDIGSNGIELVKHIKEAYDVNDIQTHIIGASVRHPLHIQEMFKLGIYGATLNDSVFDKIIVHPLTTQGIIDFRHDYLNSKLYKL